MSVRLLVGDCRQRLAELPDQSVACCVTSPPYFGLRSYLDNGHEAKHQEIGTEASLDEYITTLVAVFREVRRVLRNDGTLWLNCGSSYASARIESDEYIMRDDLTDAERAYVYAELAHHLATESEALSALRRADAPGEPAVSRVLEESTSAASALPPAGV